MLHTLEVMTSLFGVVLLLLPGGFFLWSRQPPAVTSGKIIGVLPLGMALSLTTATVLSQWSLLAAAIAVGVLSVAGAAVFIWKARVTAISQATKLLLLGISVVTVIKLVPLAIYPDPRGFDPYFHLLLADKILVAGKTVSSWQPFAMIDSINYPLGLHFLLAIVVTWLPVSLPTLFSVFTVVVVSLIGLTLYQLVRDATENAVLALVTALVFLFLPDLGSLDYPFWGGLPNALGMFLLLGSYLYIRTESSAIGIQRIVYFSLFWLAITFAHHHVMLVAGIVCFVELISSYLNRQKDPALFKDLALSGAAAFLVGSWYYVPYLQKLLTVQNTSVLSYAEPLMTPLKIWTDMGPVFCVLLIAGIAMTRFENKLNLSSLMRTPFLRLLITLIAGFVLCEYAVRLASPYVFGREINVFTPARFLTDAVPMLSLFAGVALLGLKQRWGLKDGSLLAIIIVLAAATHWPKFGSLFVPEVSAEKMAAYQFIKANSTPDAFVIDNAYATSYFSGRASSLTPIPSSEARKPLFETVAKVKALLAEGTWPEDWQSKQLLCIGSDEDLAQIPLQTKKLWQHPSGLGVFEFIRPSN